MKFLLTGWKWVPRQGSTLGLLLDRFPEIKHLHILLRPQHSLLISGTVHERNS